MRSRSLILVAVDGATDVTRTLNAARRIAKARRADIDVIDVVPRRTAGIAPRMEPWLGRLDGDDRARHARRFAPSPRPHRSVGVRLRRVTLRGSPEQVIPAYGQLNQAMLLVMQRDYGSSAFWRHSRLVDELVRQSPMPVLVLASCRPHNRDESAPRRIVTPFDFSVASAVALRTAEGLSRRHGARITLVHALGNVPRQMVFSGSEALTVIRQREARLNGAADRLRRLAGALGVNGVDTELATGDAVHAVLAAATSREADMIVVGIAHRSWLDRVVFGSTLRGILRRATVPVLAIPVVAGGFAWPAEHGVGRSRSIRPQPVGDRLAA